MTVGHAAVAAAVWVALAAAVFPPRSWQTHHPRGTLLTWWALILTAYPLIGLGLGWLVLAAAAPRPTLGPMSSLVVGAGAWGALMALGAMLSWSHTRAQAFTPIDAHARATVDALRHGTAYRSHARGRLRVTYLRSDHAMACTHPAHHEVLLTSSLVDQLSPAQVEAVIAHEAHHLTARHPLLLRVCRLHAACIPVPLVRAVHRRARLLIELAADDHAAARCGVEATIGALEKIDRVTGNHSAGLRAYRLRVGARLGAIGEPT